MPTHRAGRPRKYGIRYKSGSLKKQQMLKAVFLQQEKIMQDKMNEEKQVVLAQPHRLGNLDQRCESVFGRFCMHYGLKREVYLAGEGYCDLVKRWRAAKGVPVFNNISASGSGKGPSDQTVHKWTTFLAYVDRTIINKIGHYEFEILKGLLLGGGGLENYYFGSSISSSMICGLLCLTNCMGYVV